MYLAYTNNQLSSKNKLEAEFSAYLKEINRTLVSDDKIEDFRKEILNKYDELCKKYQRCKPITKRFYSGYFDDKNDFILEGASTSFKLLKSK